MPKVEAEDIKLTDKLAETRNRGPAQFLKKSPKK